MNKLMQLFALLPPARKVQAGASFAIILALAGLFAVGGTAGRYALMLMVAFIVGSLLWEAFRYLSARGEKAKSRGGEVSKNLGAGTGSQTADQRALEDKLLTDLEGGIAQFEHAGGDLYVLPWFILVGPPASGKSRLLARSTIVDERQKYQGVGGTLGMHWWLADKAVFLDLAGAVFMEQGQAGRWESFLNWLKKYRKLQPISGALLVVSAEDLLREPPEATGPDNPHAAASVIRAQFDRLREKLDIRFPVWVVITKCDLIPGFKELFNEIRDFDEQHQILGWSARKDLDVEFKPEDLDSHIGGVLERLRQFRLRRLKDAVRARDPRAGHAAIGRQTDQADTLFALTDEMASMIPRLKRYLESIFTRKPLAPPPPFLRGIYFTSSEQKGLAISERLRKIGAKLPEEPVADRAFFNRDLFVEKVYRETGLVTRASDVEKEKRKRWMYRYGGAAAVLAILFGWSVWGFFQLKHAIGDHSDFLGRNKVGISGPLLAGKADQLPLVAKRQEGDGWMYSGDDQVGAKDRTGLWHEMAANTNWNTPSQVLDQFHKLAIDRPASIPLVFRPLGWMRPVNTSIETTYRGFVHAVWLDPLIDRTLERLADEKSWQGQGSLARNRDALRAILAMVTLSEGKTPADKALATDEDKSPENAARAMLAALLGSDAAAHTVPALRLQDWNECAIRAKNNWVGAGTPEAKAGRAKLLTVALGQLESSLVSVRDTETEIGKLNKAVSDVEQAHKALNAFENDWAKEFASEQTIDTVAKYDALRARYDAGLGSAETTDKLWQTITTAITTLKSVADKKNKLVEAIDEGIIATNASIAAASKDLVSALPPDATPPAGSAPAAPAPANGATDTLRARLAQLNKSTQAGLQSWKEDVQKRLSPTGDLAEKTGNDWKLSQRLSALGKATELMKTGALPKTAPAVWAGKDDPEAEILKNIGVDIAEPAPGAATANVTAIQLGAKHLAHRRARYEYLTSEIDGMPKTADAIKEHVRKQSKVPENGFSTVPYVNWQNNADSFRAFDPVCAKELDKWKNFDEQLANNKGAVLAAGALLEQVKETRGGRDIYRDQFTRWWTDGFDAAMKPQLGSKWQDVCDKLTALNEVGFKDINDDLTRIYQMAVDATRMLPADNQKNLAIYTQAVQKINPKYVDELLKWRSFWFVAKDNNPTPAGFRERLHDIAFAGKSNEIQIKDVPYWKEWSVQILARMAGELKVTQLGQWKTAVDLAGHFPLSSNGDTNYQASLDDIKRVREAIANLGVEAENKDSRPKFDDPWSDSIDVLWSTRPTGESVANLKNVKQLCEFLVALSSQKELAIAVDEGADPDGSQQQFTIPNCEEVGFDGSGAKQLPLLFVNTRGKSTLEWSVAFPMPKDAALVFRSMKGGVPEWKPAENWWLLAGPARSNQGGVFKVCYVAQQFGQPNAGTQLFLWLRFKLPPGLQPPENWPTMESWPTAEKLFGGGNAAAPPP